MKRGYVKFLSDKANDTNLKNICKQMLISQVKERTYSERD